MCIMGMQSASLCTVRHDRKHFSRARTLPFLFEDIKAIVFPLEEYMLLEEDILVNCVYFFSILRCLRETRNESVYEQLHESNRWN